MRYCFINNSSHCSLKSDTASVIGLRQRWNSLNNFFLSCTQKKLFGNYQLISPKNNSGQTNFIYS